MRNLSELPFKFTFKLSLKGVQSVFKQKNKQIVLVFSLEHSGQQRRSLAATVPGCESRLPRSAGVLPTPCSSYEATRKLHTFVRRDKISLKRLLTVEKPAGHARPFRLRLLDG